MAESPAIGSGTKADPWVLQTPSLRSSFEMYRDEDADPAVLVCTVGKTLLHYDLRIVDDMHAMLREHADWMPLGNADEQLHPIVEAVRAHQLLERGGYAGKVVLIPNQ